MAAYLTLFGTCLREPHCRLSAVPSTGDRETLQRCTQLHDSEPTGSGRGAVLRGSNDLMSAPRSTGRAAWIRGGHGGDLALVG